jgi:hypothetical protein
MKKGLNTSRGINRWGHNEGLEEETKIQGSGKGIWEIKQGRELSLIGDKGRLIWETTFEG